MRIGILGPLEVRDGAGRPVAVSGSRLRALLVRLALDAGRPVPVGRLLDDLWDGDPPGENALQALVSRLRAAAGRDLVEHGPGGYRLAIPPDEIDAVAFERRVLAARNETDPARRAAAFREALALWRGAPPEYAAPRLEELRLTAIEDRTEAVLDARADLAPLLPELEALAAAHPLRERLRAQYMRALYASGRQADALRVYEETRQALAAELGVDPSPELAAAHLSILRQDAPAPVRAPRRTNLSAQLTSFVGREEESERIGVLLREARLVTLVGPGGAGKTRLSSELTARLVDDHPDGVWFVPLAPVSDAVDVPQAVLSGLDMPEPVRVGDTRVVARPLDRLIDVLAGKRMILVLDNCEHLIDAVARLVDRVLAEAPGVRILATSREPLGITGESLCPVPSLPLPPEDAPAEVALRYDSVRLFADRGSAVRPGFAVDATTAAHVVEICRALDGIPLAIELAAARLRSLTPAQVAGRLGDRFRLLAAGSRTALPRHRTLRAVVDWSWDLLDDGERTVLRRLSVFAGGATPAAAAAICGLPPGPSHADDVIDVIASLVEKSLVMADGENDVRYRLLETVRVYAAERLDEAGETGTVRSAHVAFLLDLAERAEPELRARDQIVWAERLNAERDNIAAAFRHVVDTRDLASGLRLFAALAWFWLMRDLEVEAGAWAKALREITDDPPAGLEEADAICRLFATLVEEMGSPEGSTPKSMNAALDRGLAFVPEEPRHPGLVLVRPAALLLRGDSDGASEGLRRVIDHPDPWVGAVARVILGHIALNAGEIDTGHDHLRAAYEGLRTIGDRWGMMVALGGLMELALARGETALCVRFGEEALGYATGGVSPEQGAAVRVLLARAYAEDGDVERARSELHRGIADAERIGEFPDAATGLLWLAELARREGDLAAARPSLERALDLVQTRKTRPDMVSTTAMTFSRLGSLSEQAGDLAAAESWHTRALRETSDDIFLRNPLVALLLEGIAAYHAAVGDHVRAAELLGTAHTLHGYRDALSYDVQRATSAAEAALGPDGFAEAYERGRKTSRDEAVAVKLTPAGHTTA
ncbi:BTAD domain-containing putative transcriptional regulator [Spirillospora sp. CA-294931]|uniref:BTAD domain-containing putative transcriptional regulator n=1 Tax=Spirillospora sp. CA-294931 TaxID=3240042 RepID=UPI003D90C32E